MESFATGYQRLDLDEDETVNHNDDDHFLHILETPRRSSGNLYQQKIILGTFL